MTACQKTLCQKTVCQIEVCHFTAQPSYFNDYLYFKANWMISKGFMTICKVMLDVQRTESMNCNRNWKTVQVSMPKIEICPVFIGSFPIY